MYMRLYEVVFDEDQDKGVYALSCVENPAMEDTWLTLAEHPKEIQFAAVDEEKQLLMGAALIPNKKVYRNDNSGEYYITFSEETIEKCAHNFVKNGFVNNSSENHDIKLDGVSVVQSWIVEDPEKDKSANYGKKYEKGTWVTMMKVENPDTWEKAKNGQLNGFSIDGLFSLKEMNLSTNKNEVKMNKQNIIDAVKEALSLSKKEEIQMGELKLKDGKTKVMFDGDKPEVGMPAFLKLEDGEREKMPKGSHELESGEFLNVDENGLVAAEEVKEEVAEPSKEEIAAELAEILKGFKAEFSKEVEDIKKEFSLKLEAEKKKNIELEAKLEEEPAEKKIVKTELQVAEPKTTKDRIWNAIQLNKN